MCLSSRYLIIFFHPQILHQNIQGWEWDGHLLTAHLRETLDPARALTSSLTPPDTKLPVIVVMITIVLIIVIVVDDTRPPSPTIVMMMIINVFFLITVLVLMTQTV